MDTHYINEVLKGNTEAFGHLIRTHQNKAFGIAISMVKNEDHAKDVVQESFIMAYESLANFRNDSKFSTWIYRIVVNTALQLLNREKRKEEVIQDYLITDDEKASYNDALGQLKNQDLKGLIKKVFEGIPTKEALVLQLFYIDGLSITEIEEITDFTMSNIKVLLHRGRNSFYKILKGKENFKPY